MQYSIHNIHKRKRHKRRRYKTNQLEQYPSRDVWINLLDQIMIVIAIIGPIMILPQLYKVYFEQSVEGLSLFTWVMLSLIKTPWIIYGFVHKDFPIFISSCLWAIEETFIAIGIVLFS